MTEVDKLVLPPAPASETGAVKAWSQPVQMRTYATGAPDPNPMFLEKRVYQGSTGKVYPLPVIDRVATEAQLQSWQAIHLENEYVRVMLLPEIGGRIHVGLDKRNGYDFFYRQNVIKPALVGLAGPWISGGVEFNWPQHHRPATYMPVQTHIERSSDGSITVWCSDHDPMARMKGMHGVCLRPGSTRVEVRVRLYNRTQLTQTFLWWANVATRVHEKYQSFFPEDVRMAADHAKRATTSFPLSKGLYYGVDYGGRGVDGVSPDDAPSNFLPDGSYAPNDLSWYTNIPVPTSYMICNSRGDFAGGYDHARNAGLVYAANHHIAPGKKQWTWGNHAFGYAWDRNLTDDDGPYIELMAGAYTDNQPDFSFLAPGETKTFSQTWYPIQETGVPNLANELAALRVERDAETVNVHLEVTQPIQDAVVRVQGAEPWHGSLSPDQTAHLSFTVKESERVEVVLEAEGRITLRYAPDETEPAPPPEIATEPPAPTEIASADELFLTGLHLEQYRHPTRMPEDYWREALRRDEGDSRPNIAMGRWHLLRGELQYARRHFERAIERLTRRNPNPYDGEAHYYLGITLRHLAQDDSAYDAFYKSTWNAAWRGPAYHRLAEIDCARKDWERAAAHLDRSLRSDMDNLNARNLLSAVLKHLARAEQAGALAQETAALDHLDAGNPEIALKLDNQQRMDLALDRMRAGLADAIDPLLAAEDTACDGTAPLRYYVLAHWYRRNGETAKADAALRNARAASPLYCFPSRVEEMLALESALAQDEKDARAHYYLGNFLYDRKRHSEAIDHWRRSVDLDPAFATAWRNLGIGAYNYAHDADAALVAYGRARRLAPNDARILYEYDQLRKRMGASLTERRDELQQNAALVAQRDDLSIELASLYNSLARPQDALRLLMSRRFQPWEGGEGQVLAQYERAHLLLTHEALRKGDNASALDHMRLAEDIPEQLNEARHLLQNKAMLHYWRGVAEEACGNHEAAEQQWKRAASFRMDFQQMQVQPVSEKTLWSVLGLQRLGRQDESNLLRTQIADHAEQLLNNTPKIDYFATSLPAMLLFDEDMKARQNLLARLLIAQAGLAGTEKEQAQAMEDLEKLITFDPAYSEARDLILLFN